MHEGCAFSCTDDRADSRRANGPDFPPVARIEPVTDTYFGEKVTDPYRWMENEKDGDWLPFLQAQNAYARTVLGRLPGREALLARIQQLSDDIAASGKLQLAGSRVFCVVSGVGWHNPLRYVAEQNGYGEEPEWGAINDPAGYRAVKSIDSYQAVADGTKYPAVLLTTGGTDPRVAPFHPAEMTARLQAATNSGKLVLLRVDFDAGHGIGSTRAQQDAEAADTHAFILWQTSAKALLTEER